MNHATARATARTPCPISHIDARRVWLHFGLVIVGCAVGGLALGYLGAAIVVDRILHPN